MRLGVNGRFLAARRGGVRRFAEGIAAGLLREAECVVLLPRGPAPDGALPSGVETRTGRLRGHAWEQLELPGAARRAGCDVVVHLANTVPLSGGPHVATVHDVTPLTDPRWFGRRYAAWHRWVVAPALRRARALLTVSEWSAAEVRRALGVPVHRVHVVDQGVAPLDGPAPAAEVAAVRRRYRLGGSWILAVGAGDPRKNVAFLAVVLERLEGRLPGDGPALVVVGRRDGGRIWAKPPALPTTRVRVVHVGEVDDATLRALYTGAAVLGYPSLAEGFGRPPLEAMACGTPVVTAPYGAAREVLGDAAEHVPLDPGAWTAALERVLDESPEARARRIERGRRQAARHRWKDGVARVLEVCRDVAGARAPVRGRTP